MTVRVGFDTIMNIVSKQYEVSEDALMRSPMEERARAAQAMAVYLAKILIDVSDYAIMRAFQISQVADVETRVDMIEEEVSSSEEKKNEVRSLISLILIRAGVDYKTFAEQNPEEAEKRQRIEKLFDHTLNLAMASLADPAKTEDFEAAMAELDELDPDPEPKLTEEELHRKAQALMAEAERAAAMDYEKFLEYTTLELERLKTKDITDDYKLCKALAACYELQEYLTNRIAEVELRKNPYRD